MSNDLETRLASADPGALNKKAAERVGILGLLAAYFRSTIPGINILAAPYVIPKLWAIFKERRSFQGIRAKHAELKMQDPIYRTVGPKTKKMKRILVEWYKVPEDSPR